MSLYNIAASDNYIVHNTGAGTLKVYKSVLGDWTDATLHQTISVGLDVETIAIDGTTVVASVSSTQAYVYNADTGAQTNTLTIDHAYDGYRTNENIAVSGNYALFGNYTETDVYSNSGRARIVDVTTGSVVSTIDNPNDFSTKAGDYFGWTVAIDGSYAAVAATREDKLGATNVGQVYIFNTVLGDWSDTSLLYTLDPQATNSSYIKSIDISGDYAAIMTSTETTIIQISTGNLIQTLAHKAEGQSTTDSRSANVVLNGSYVAIAELDVIDTTNQNAVDSMMRSSVYYTALGDWTDASLTVSKEYFGLNLQWFHNYNNRIAISGSHVVNLIGTWIDGEVTLDIYPSDGSATPSKTILPEQVYYTPEFANVISTDSNYIICGSPDISGITEYYTGNAGIFDTSGNLIFALQNPTPSGFLTYASSRFGASVDISGNYAVVGAPGDLFYGNPYPQPVDYADDTIYGRIHIYYTALGDWTDTVLLHTIDDPSASTGSMFGYEVVIDGTEVYVSTPRIGAVRSYNLATGNLTQEFPKLSIGFLDNTTTFQGSWFGTSLSVSNGYLAVGHRGKDTNSTDNEGEVIIYDIASNSIAARLSNPNAGNGSENDFFGAKVELDNGYAIVTSGILFDSSDINIASGDTTDDVDQRNLGTIHVFKTTLGDWSDITTEHTLSGFVNDYWTRDMEMGWDISASSGKVVVGCPSYDDGANISYGNAFVYDIATGAMLYNFENPHPITYPLTDTDKFGWYVHLNNDLMCVSAKYKISHPYESGYWGASGGRAYAVDITTLSVVTPVAVNDIGYSTTLSEVVTGDLRPNDQWVTFNDTYELDGSYPGVTLNPDGTFEYTPSVCYLGDYIFQYKIVKPNGTTSNTATVTIEVIEPLPIVADDSYTNINSETTNGNLGTNDPCVITGYTFELVGGPYPEVNLNSNGTFSFTPSTCFVGDYIFQYRVLSTPSNFASNTATVTIACSEPKVIAVNEAYTSNSWDTVLGDVSDNDICSDPSYTYAIVGTPPAELDYFNADGTFSFSHVAPFLGSKSFQYNVTKPNSYVSNTATVTVTSNGVIANNDTFTSVDSELVSGSVATNDTYGNGDTFALVSDPSGYVLSFNSDGSFTFQAPAPFLGDYVFTYKLIDGSTLAESTASVTVQCSRTPIVVVDDAYDSLHWATVVNDVSANDTVLPVDTYELVGGPYSDMDYFNTDGTFSYTPSWGNADDRVFQYRVLDGYTGLYHNATVTISYTRTVTVVAVDDNYDTYNWVQIAGDVSLNDTYDPAIDSFVLVSDPEGLVDSFNSDGTFTATNNFPLTIVESFTYGIVDSRTSIVYPATVNLDSHFTYDLSEYPRLRAQAGNSDYNLYMRFPFLRNSIDTATGLATHSARFGEATDSTVEDTTAKIIAWIDTYGHYTNNTMPKAIAEVIDPNYFDNALDAKPSEIPDQSLSGNPEGMYTMADAEFWVMGISEINDNIVYIYLDSSYATTGTIWFGPDPTFIRDGWFSEAPNASVCNNSPVNMTLPESSYDGSAPFDGELYDYYNLKHYYEIYGPPLASPFPARWLPGYMYDGGIYYNYRLSPTGTYHDFEEPRGQIPSTYVNSTGITSYRNFITDPVYMDLISPGEGDVNTVYDLNGNLIEPATVTVTSEIPSTRHTTRSMKTNVITTGARRFMFEFEYAPMTLSDASMIIDSLERYKGRNSYFYMPIPYVAALGVNTFYDRAGNTDNTVDVFESVHPSSGETSGGKYDDTVVLFNCPVDYFPAGLIFRFSNHDKVYKTISEATRSSNGDVKLHFDPPLLQSVDGAQIVLRELYDGLSGKRNLVRAKLMDDYFDYTTDASGLVSLKIKLYEDIQ